MPKADLVQIRMNPLMLLFLIEAQRLGRFVKMFSQVGLVQDELHVGKLILQFLTQTLTTVGDRVAPT